MSVVQAPGLWYFLWLTKQTDTESSGGVKSLGVVDWMWE